MLKSSPFARDSIYESGKRTALGHIVVMKGAKGDEMSAVLSTVISLNAARSNMNCDRKWECGEKDNGILHE